MTVHTYGPHLSPYAYDYRIAPPPTTPELPSDDWWWSEPDTSGDDGFEPSRPYGAAAHYAGVTVEDDYSDTSFP